MPSKMFGPYFKEPSEHKWHLMKSCPDFPAGANIQTMLSSQKLDIENLCEKCMEIEELNLRGIADIKT